MIKRINNTSGQTALILILLAAAALIFLAITLNWGRIAQVKSMETVAADEAATTLASDAASYGEMEKQTYLSNSNYQWSLSGVLIDFIILVVSIILAVIPATAPAAGWALGLAIAGMTMTFVTMVLQLVWINPVESKLWNNLQKNQPIQQQFYEQGLSTALQGLVTDQGNITDYFDWNANGQLGNNASGLPNDVVGRFSLFYTERLKMLNQSSIPQIAFFYDQLGEAMNGQTCAQSGTDNFLYGFPFNAACPADCIPTALNPIPSDPACQVKLPNGFQINDSCIDSSPSGPKYNPYCDPCCQPTSVPNPSYCNPSAPSGGTTACTGTTSSGAACNCDSLTPQYISLRPSTCDQDTTYNGAPIQCLTNNPFGATPTNYVNIPTLLYDPSYQEYATGISFLDQFGRDQQMGPFTTSLTPQGLFPNGIYPFFWLMKDYSPEVDNINPLINPLTPGSMDLHWCAASVSIPPAGAAPSGFSDLAQLSLPYSCQSQDCCVNYLANTLAGGVPVPAAGNNTVIDIVGSSFTTSPATNPALDPSFGEGGSGSWLEGDDQFCSASWRYNGASTSIPDGTCEWTGNTTVPPSNVVPPNVNNSDITSGITVDGLDDAMHTLSDFVNFANNFIGQDVGVLSSSFDTWYPQAATWIAPECGGSIPAPACNDSCDDGSSCVGGVCSLSGNACNNSDGRLLSIYNPYASPVVDKFSTWNNVITTWLSQNYTNANAWCVPSEVTLLNGNATTAEDTYINSSSGTGPWGDLPHVISCLNYNSNQNPASSTVNNYQQCQQLLTTACPGSVAGTACDPSILGRTLVSAAVEPMPAFDGCSGKYAAWVNDSLTLAQDEAPKFALREQFLNDVYTRAKTMQTILTQGDIALQTFLQPCGSSPTCADGGPAAQLMYARTHPTPTEALPNSVIYGWVDKKLPNGQGGYAHIVKVTAYAPGRNGTGSTANGVAQSLLPWIKTTTHLFTRDYELRNRDGAVYVSVKRWDQDHSNSLLFPNGHPLWQFLFHDPKASPVTILPSCVGSGGFGFGLGSQTIAALTTLQLTSPSLPPVSPADQTLLSQAFMLNDNGNGQVDPTAKTDANYSKCISEANALLMSAPESHACVEYIGSRNASVVPSGQGDSDYSLKFVDCSTVDGGTLPPEDLAGSSS